MKSWSGILGFCDKVECYPGELRSVHLDQLNFFILCSRQQLYCERMVSGRCCAMRIKNGRDNFTGNFYLFFNLIPTGSELKLKCLVTSKLTPNDPWLEPLSWLLKKQMNNARMNISFCFTLFRFNIFGKIVSPIKSSAH